MSYVLRLLRSVGSRSGLPLVTALHLVGCPASDSLGDASVDAGERLDANVEAGPSDASPDAEGSNPDAGDGGLGVVVLDGEPDTVFEVAPGASREFVFDAPVSGAYDFRFHGADGMSLPDGLVLWASTTADFSPAERLPCGTDPSFPTCRFSAIPAGRLYFRVFSEGDGATEPFTLAPIHTLGVGAYSDPVQISSVPSSTAVDGWGFSVYEFTTGAAGAYRVVFGDGDDADFVAWTFGVGADTPPLQSCVDVPCMLNNLDADTRYGVGVNPRGGREGTFEMAIVRGFAEGSFHDPVPVDVSGVIETKLEPQAVGFYEFDAPSAGSYRFALTDASVSEAVLAIAFATEDTVYANGPCWMWHVASSCVLADVVAGRNVLAVSNLGVQLTEASITITAEP